MAAPQSFLNYLSSAEVEGNRSDVYTDTKGNPTAGVGHKLTKRELETYKVGDEVPQEVRDKWLKEDSAKAWSAAQTQATELGVSDSLFLERLASVNFQLGTNWNKEHTKTWKLLKEGKYDEALTEAEDSKWFEQTPKRIRAFQEGIAALMPVGEMVGPTTAAQATRTAEFADTPIRDIFEARLPQTTPKLTDWQGAQETISTKRQLFSRGVSSGAYNLAANINYFDAAWETLTGDEWEANQSLQHAQLLEEIASEYMIGVPTFEDALHSSEKFSDLVDQTVLGLGQFTPSMLASITSAVIGSILAVALGSTAPLWGGLAVGGAAKFGFSQSSKMALRKIIGQSFTKKGKKLLSKQKVWDDQLAEGSLKLMQKVLGRPGAKREMFTRAGLSGIRRPGAVGGLAGAYAQEYVQGTGITFGTFAREGMTGRREAAISMGVGVPYAGVGVGAEVIMATSVITPLLRIIKRKIATASAAEAATYMGLQKELQKIGADLGMGFAQGAVAEGGAETIQDTMTGLQRLAIDDDYTTAQMKMDVMEAAFKGVTSGGLFAGGGRGVSSTAESVFRKSRDMLGGTQGGPETTSDTPQGKRTTQKQKEAADRKTRRILEQELKKDKQRKVKGTEAVVPIKSSKMPNLSELDLVPAANFDISQPNRIFESLKDIKAQLSNIFNPKSGKDSFFVSSAMLDNLPTAKEMQEIIGENTVFSHAIDGVGMLISTAKNKVDEFRRTDGSRASIAKALGKLRLEQPGDDIVIEVQNKEGAVVHRELTNQQDREKAAEKQRELHKEEDGFKVENGFDIQDVNEDQKLEAFKSSNIDLANKTRLTNSLSNIDLAKTGEEVVRVLQRFWGSAKKGEDADFFVLRGIYNELWGGKEVTDLTKLSLPLQEWGKIGEALKERLLQIMRTTLEGEDITGLSGLQITEKALDKIRATQEIQLTLAEEQEGKTGQIQSTLEAVETQEKRRLEEQRKTEDEETIAEEEILSIDSDNADGIDPYELTIKEAEQDNVIRIGKNKTMFENAEPYRRFRDDLDKVKNDRAIQRAYTAVKREILNKLAPQEKANFNLLFDKDVKAKPGLDILNEFSRLIDINNSIDWKIVPVPVHVLTDKVLKGTGWAQKFYKFNFRQIPRDVDAYKLSFPGLSPPGGYFNILEMLTQDSPLPVAQGWVEDDLGFVIEHIPSPESILIPYRGESKTGKKALQERLLQVSDFIDRVFIDANNRASPKRKKDAVFGVITPEDAKEVLARVNKKYDKVDKRKRENKKAYADELDLEYRKVTKPFDVSSVIHLGRALLKADQEWDNSNLAHAFNAFQTILHQARQHGYEFRFKANQKAGGKVLNKLDVSIPLQDVAPMQLIESKGKIYSEYTISDLIRNSSDQRGTTQRLKGQITSFIKSMRYNLEGTELTATEGTFLHFLIKEVDEKLINSKIGQNLNKLWDSQSKSSKELSRIKRPGKIVTGGQEGVDFLGLEIADGLKIPTGGIAPLGYLNNAKDKAQHIESLKNYGLVESEQSKETDTNAEKYRVRTHENILKSDATIVFTNWKENTYDTEFEKGAQEGSPGTNLTIKLARQEGKPLIVNPTWYELNEFMFNHGLEGKTINIAGPRDLTTERAEQIRELLEQEWAQEEVVGVNYPSLEEEEKPFPNSSALTLIDKAGGLDTTAVGEFAKYDKFRLPQTKRNPFRTKAGRKDDAPGQMGLRSEDEALMILVEAGLITEDESNETGALQDIIYNEIEFYDSNGVLGRVYTTDQQWEAERFEREARAQQEGEMVEDSIPVGGKKMDERQEDLETKMLDLDKRSGLLGWGYNDNGDLMLFPNEDKLSEYHLLRPTTPGQENQDRITVYQDIHDAIYDTVQEQDIMDLKPMDMAAGLSVSNLEIEGMRTPEEEVVADEYDMMQMSSIIAGWSKLGEGIDMTSLYNRGVAVNNSLDAEIDFKYIDKNWMKGRLPGIKRTKTTTSMSEDFKKYLGSLTKPMLKTLDSLNWFGIKADVTFLTYNDINPEYNSKIKREDLEVGLLYNDTQSRYALDALWKLKQKDDGSLKLHPAASYQIREDKWVVVVDTYPVRVQPYALKFLSKEDLITLSKAFKKGKFTKQQLGEEMAQIYVAHEIGHIVKLNELEELHFKPGLRDRLLEAYEEAKKTNPVYRDTKKGFAEFDADRTAEWLLRTVRDGRRVGHIKAEDGVSAHYKGVSKKVMGVFENLVAGKSTTLSRISIANPDKLYAKWVDSLVKYSKDQQNFEFSRRKLNFEQKGMMYEMVEDNMKLNKLAANNKSWNFLKKKIGQELQGMRDNNPNVRDWFARVFTPADQYLRGLGEAGEELALVFTQLTQKVREGYIGWIDAKDMTISQFHNQITDILGLKRFQLYANKLTKEQKTSFLLAEDDTVSDATLKVLNPIGWKLRQWLRKFYTEYLTQPVLDEYGEVVLNKDKEPIPILRIDFYSTSMGRDIMSYFPRTLDVYEIANNDAKRADFEQLLIEKVEANQLLEVKQIKQEYKTVLAIVPEEQTAQEWATEFVDNILGFDPKDLEAEGIENMTEAELNEAKQKIIQEKLAEVDQHSLRLGLPATMARTLGWKHMQAVDERGNKIVDEDNNPVFQEYGIKNAEFRALDLTLEPHQALLNYIRQSVKRVELERRGGSEYIEGLIMRLPKKNQPLARDALRAIMGKVNGPMDPLFRKMNSWGLAANIMTTLTFSVLASFPDFAGPVLRSKDFRGFMHAAQSLFGEDGYFANKEEVVKFALEIGAISQDALSISFIHASEMDYMTPGSKKITDVFFRTIMLEQFTRFSRVFASLMGQRFLASLVDETSSTPRDVSQRWAKEFDMSLEEIQTWKNGDKKKGIAPYDFSTPEGKKAQVAIYQFVNESIIRPNAAQRPIWASNPYFALVWQLKGFFYAYGKTIVGGQYREMINRYNEAGFGAASLPIAMMGLTILPLTMLGLELREYIKVGIGAVLPGAEASPAKHIRTDNMPWDTYLYEIFDRSGMAGPFGILFPILPWGQYHGPQGLESGFQVLGPSTSKLALMWRQGPLDWKFWKEQIPFYYTVI